jgi:hypothetical protein
MPTKGITSACAKKEPFKKGLQEKWYTKKLEFDGVPFYSKGRTVSGKI